MIAQLKPYSTIKPSGVEWQDRRKKRSLGVLFYRERSDLHEKFDGRLGSDFTVHKTS